MLDLGGADAVRQRAECAMGRGVAVAADDRGARQGEALLGADDVDNALTLVVLVEIFNAELGRVVGQRLDLNPAFLVLDAERPVRRGRDIVIDHGQRLLRRTHLAVHGAQAFERLRAGHFMHQVPVDIEQAGAVILLIDHVVVPDLVVECARCGHDGGPYARKMNVVQKARG